MTDRRQSSPRVGLVTDSNSQLPETLAGRYGVEVVPLTVTVDGTPYAEGTELGADDFYARWADGATPEVTTAAPPPGAFVDAYQRLVDRGVDEIVSIHIGSAVSSALNAARLAADLVDVPVRLVDTGTASFGISCCVWEAAEVLRRGGSVAEATAVAEAVAPTVGNVFVVGGLDIVRTGGRLATDAGAAAGIPVLSLIDGEITSIGAAADVEAATDVMAQFVLANGPGLRVAVGIADREAEPLSLALEDRLRTDEAVVEVVRYRIGPSVGAHTGPGTAGCFFWPAASVQ